MNEKLQSHSHDIVVIDDDELTLEVIRRTLRGTALDLVYLNNEEAALDYLQRHTCSLLLVDQRMPRMSGLELLTELARCNRLAGTRAFLCSAVDLPRQVSANAAELGVAPLLKDAYRNKEQLLAMLPRNNVNTNVAAR